MQSRPHILLVLIRCPHSLDNFVTFRYWDAPLLSDDLSEESIHFTCHTRGITADVKVCLLFEELVDFGGGFLKLVLDVDLAWSLA
jgi:hypothetical protein